LYNNGIIKNCNSQWNTPLICVYKKESKDIRLCLDFRKLYQITTRQAFPMPNVEELLDRLGGSVWFSIVNLGSAYYQVELEESSQDKTAFSTKNGQYCFTRMPFGIAAAPGTFQEMMAKILGDMKNTMVYLDDIMIYTKNREEHYVILNNVLKRIRECGLRINPMKCHLLCQEVKFLGHIIDKDGVKTDPSKIDAIKTFERPKCIKNLRSFLGICNYYRRFIEGYARKSRALEELCGVNTNKLIWTETYDRAFNEMKYALTSTPILAFPDVRETFILDTDASFDTIGAVLSQNDENGKERVIAYGSHAMSNHEKGYCITRKELLAIYYFCNHFKHYLYGTKFKVRTDHKAIEFMFKTKKPVTPQFQTWMNYLSSLDMELKYRKGVEHTNADMLSRKTCGTCVQCQMSHEEPKTGKIKTRTINTVEINGISKWQHNNEEINKIRLDIEGRKSSKFRVVDNIVQTQDGKMWIPFEKRHDLVKYVHNLLAHAGTEKMLKYIQNAYDMQNVQEVVVSVAKHCEACQRYKVVTTKTKEERVVLSAKEPFEKIYMDICGPFKETFRRKRYILAIVDQYSRYVSITAITRQDEETIRKELMENWILKHGAPKEIHVDCGKSFVSKTFKEMANSMNSRLCFSSPYHHNTNGLVERQFRTIRDFINTTLKDRDTNDWESLVPEIEFVLNATVQKTLGCSPAEIIFGRTICRETWVSQTPDLQKPADNESKTRRSFQIGDEVLVKAESRTKDQERYIGPYKVCQKIHDRRY